MSKELTTSLVDSVKDLVVTRRDAFLVKKEGITRFISRKANVMRTESVVRFGSYVDEDGNASSGPAKYNMGLNSKIKKLFGVAKEDMKDELMLSVVTQIDSDIALAHETGIANKLTREQIRKNAHRLCELGFEHYEMKKKLLEGKNG